MADALKDWRKETRKRLIAERVALEETQRQCRDKAISQRLHQYFANMAGHTIGFCWPHQAEYDAREWVAAMLQKGAKAALPVVVEKKAPLVFRRWVPGTAMMAGEYGIPVPANNETVAPSILIAPLNGFDEQGYRLGYGSGYFDRTLATLHPKPVVIGIGYEQARLATIEPQPHDIAMDFIVTEAAIYQVRDGKLAIIDEANESGERHQYSSPPCYAHEVDPAYFGDVSPKDNTD